MYAIERRNCVRSCVFRLSVWMFVSRDRMSSLFIWMDTRWITREQMIEKQSTELPRMCFQYTYTVADARLVSRKSVFVLVVCVRSFVLFCWDEKPPCVYSNIHFYVLFEHILCENHLCAASHFILHFSINLWRARSKNFPYKFLSYKHINHSVNTYFTLWMRR